MERKVIIEDGTFYYVTVDDNYQIGTLYSGDVDSKIGDAKAYAIPAGRGISAETNPLAWDIRLGEMYAVNFLDHSLNDRNESIKKIPLADLKVWTSGVELEDIIMESIDQHTFVLNQPFLYVKQRSKYLNHFYFDGLAHNGEYWMVMTNNDELTIWKNVAGNWASSEVQSFKVNGFFNLMMFNNELHLITQEGAVYQIDLKGMTAVQMELNDIMMNEVILVEDRDQKKVYYLKNGLFNHEKSLTELIQTAGVKLL